MQQENLIVIREDEQTVSARYLYEQLEVSKRFSSWFDTNSQGFIEGEDFTSVLVGTEVRNNGGFQHRELQDYQLSLDMAKHICLMSRTDKGKQMRAYLIQLEKDWNTPEKVMARALKIANRTIEQTRAELVESHRKLEEQKPKVLFADSVEASKGSILVRDLAKMIKQNGVDIGEKRLWKWFREHGWICKGTTTPTQRAMERGLFEIIERTVSRGNSEPIATLTTKVTGKGQIFFINKLVDTKD